MKISRKTLLVVSVLADALDLLTVSLWGGTQWFPLIEFPVVILHFLYAGPKAALAMFDLIPGLGLLPLYTVAALLYKDPKKKPSTVVVDTGVPGSNRSRQASAVVGDEPPPILLLPASTTPLARSPQAESSTGEDSIYLSEDGIQRGPFAREQVRRMLRAGEVSNTALCWFPEMKQWAPIGNHFPL